MNQSIALVAKFLDSSESIIHNQISWKHNYEDFFSFAGYPGGTKMSTFKVYMCHKECERMEKTYFKACVTVHA